MELLNLSKCKTNADVCKLVSERVCTLYRATFEVEKDLYTKNRLQTLFTRAFRKHERVFKRPGGYGKSNLIKFVLDFYKIPYTVVVGYKDMPVDALLGIPDMSKLLNEQVRSQFQGVTFL
jgi:hypothetical protein